MAKITDTELKNLDQEVIAILKRISPEKFEDIENPLELQAKRKEAIKQLESLKEKKRKLPQLEKDMDEKFQELKKAKEHYKEIGKVYNQARTLFNNEANDVTMGIEKNERILLKTSSQKLRKRLSEIKGEIKSLRETQPTLEKIKNQEFPKTGYTIVTSKEKIMKKINSLKNEMQKTITEMLNERME